MNSSASFACPFCQAVCKDPRAATWTGKKIRCSQCGQVFVLDHRSQVSSLPPAGSAPGRTKPPRSRKHTALIVLGGVMVLIAGLIISSNVSATKQNERTIQEHPYVTLFSGGENLQPAYSFTSPYTGFELLVMAIGIAGVGLILYRLYRRRRDET